MNHDITTDPDQDENSKPSDGTHQLESIYFLPYEFSFMLPFSASYFAWAEFLK